MPGAPRQIGIPVTGMCLFPGLVPSLIDSTSDLVHSVPLAQTPFEEEVRRSRKHLRQFPLSPLFGDFVSDWSFLPCLSEFAHLKHVRLSQDKSEAYS